ncbi:aryl-alcohol dehydrogenase-like predicted oxidoreductase [Bradyrhizobium sp. GM22.5]
MVSQSALPRRTLGRTGLEVSILGFGTAPLGDLFLELDDHTAIAAASRAFELGINLLDTSPHYGNGLSEHRCGTALRRVPRKDVVLCTKNWSLDGSVSPAGDSVRIYWWTAAPSRRRLFL